MGVSGEAFRVQSDRQGGLVWIPRIGLASMINPEVDWHQIAEEHYGSKPHPRAPSLTVRDFPIAIELATATRFGGHATHTEAEAFWREFQNLKMAPAQYLRLLDQLAPLAFRYHGRPPSMEEIAKHQESDPKAMRDYYSELPHKLYPDVSAGQMMRWQAMADPYAQQHLGRKALLNEARSFAHGNMGPQQIDHVYQGLKTDREEKRPQALPAQSSEPF